MEIEPKAVSFREMRLGSPYSASLCLTNPLGAEVDFRLRPSSSRVSITPTEGRLGPGQSMICTVRLTISNAPPMGTNGEPSPVREYVHLRSRYFDQKVSIEGRVSLASLHNNASTVSAGSNSGNRCVRSASPTIVRSSFATREAENTPRLNRSYSCDLDTISTMSMGDLRRELRNRIERIAELERIISYVDTQCPDIEAAVNAAVSEERASFEEKSERVLQILRAKDTEIENLNHQIYMMNTEIESLRQIVDAPRPPDASSLPSDWSLSADRLSLLGQREQLASVLAENTRLKERVAGLEIIRPTSQPDNSGRENVSALLREVQALREKTADQAEQLDVLVGEVATLRKASEQDHILQDRLRAECETLRNERSRSQTQIDELKATLNDVRESLRETRSDNVSLRVQCDSLRKQSSQNANAPPVEEAFEGGLSLSTPHNFHPPRDENTATTAAVRFAADCEERMRQISERLAEREQECTSLTESLALLRQELAAATAEEGRQRSEADALRTHVAELVEALEEAPPLTISTSVNKPPSMPSTTPGRDNIDTTSKEATQAAIAEALAGHEWWSYVWHEMKRQSSLDIDTLMNGGSTNRPGDLCFSPSDNAEAAAHLARLRENVRLQALEIAALRQELLGHRLTTRQQVSQLQAELDLALRDKARSAALLRTRRDDKETRITELTAAVKSLSSRSEAHAQVAATRQELIAERLLVTSLRQALDDTRLSLDTTQRRLAETNRELATATGRLDAAELLQSFSAIPAVAPATALELMALELRRCRSEADVAKERVMDLELQLRRVVSSARHGNANIVAGTPLRSPSPAPRKKVSLAGAEAAADLFGTSSGGILESAGLEDSVHGGIGPAAEASLIGEALYGNGNDACINGSPAAALSTLSPEGVNQLSDWAAGKSRGVTLNSVGVNGEDSVESLPIPLLVSRLATAEALAAEARRECNAWRETAESVSASSIMSGSPVTVAAVEATAIADESTRVNAELTTRRLEAANDRVESLAQELRETRAALLVAEQRLSTMEINRLVPPPPPPAAVTAANADALAALHGDIESMAAATANRTHPATDRLESQSWLLEDAAPHLSTTSPTATGVNESKTASGGTPVGLVAVATLRAETQTLRKELEETRATLRERTAQIRVLMDSLEATAAAGVASIPDDSGLRDLELPHGGEGETSESDGFLIPGHGNGNGRQPWVTAALIRRVVELTAETAAAMASASLAKAANETLRAEAAAAAAEANTFRAQALASEAEARSLRVAAETAAAEAAAAEAARLAESFSARESVESAAESIRQAETRATEAELHAEEAKRLLAAAEKHDATAIWKTLTQEASAALNSVETYAPPTLPSSSSEGNEKTSGVTDLVAQLLQEWRAELPATSSVFGNIKPPSFATHSANNGSNGNVAHASPVPRLTRAEQRFQARVAGLILGADRRAASAEEIARSAQRSAEAANREKALIKSQLAVLSASIPRLSRRAAAFEALVRSGERASAKHESGLNRVLRQRITNVQKRKFALEKELAAERKQRAALQIDRAAQTSIRRRLQAALAEHESRGDAVLRAREEALSVAESRAASVESSLRQWFVSQLPALIAGLPIAESSIGGRGGGLFGTNGGLVYDSCGAGAGFAPFLSGNNITNGLSYPAAGSGIPSVGLADTDGLSGLATALCQAKAEAAAACLTATAAEDRLALERQRRVHVEGILLRWRDQVEAVAVATHAAIGSSPLATLWASADNEPGSELPLQIGASTSAAEGSSVMSAVGLSLEREARLVAAEADALAAKEAAEDALAEMKARCEVAEKKCEAAQAAVSSLVGSEDDVRSRGMSQMIRLRSDLEDAHANQLRALREAYDAERSALISELNAVADAVDEAALGGDGIYIQRNRPPVSINDIPPNVKNVTSRRPSLMTGTADSFVVPPSLRYSTQPPGDWPNGSDWAADSPEPSILGNSPNGLNSALAGLSEVARADGSGDSSGISGGGAELGHLATETNVAGTGFREAISSRTGPHSEAAAAALHPGIAACEAIAHGDISTAGPVLHTGWEGSGVSSADMYLDRLARLDESDPSAVASLRDVAVESLRRELAAERRAAEEARADAAEYAALLSSQQAWLVQQRDVLAAANNVASHNSVHQNVVDQSNPQFVNGVPSGERASNGVSFTGVAGSNTANRIPDSSHLSNVRAATQVYGVLGNTTRAGDCGPLSAVESEVRKEARDLWPSLETLVTELGAILTSFIDRMPLLSNTDTRVLRSAVSTAARIRVLLADANANQQISSNKIFGGIGSKNMTSSDKTSIAQSSTSRRVDEAVASMEAYLSPLLDSVESRDDSLTAKMTAVGNTATALEKALHDHSSVSHLPDLAQQLKQQLTILQERIRTERSAWAEERKQLLAAQGARNSTHDGTSNVIDSKFETAGSTEDVRRRLTIALRESEEALESHTAAAKAQIAALEEALRKSQADAKANVERLEEALRVAQAATVAETERSAAQAAVAATLAAQLQHAQFMSSSVSPPLLAPPSIQNPLPSQNVGISGNTSGNMAIDTQEHGTNATISSEQSNSSAEFVRLQRLLDSTQTELANTRTASRESANAAAKEIAELRAAFTRYRQAQERLVTSLDATNAIVDLSSPLPSTATTEANTDERVSRLEYRYRLKCAELDAALRMAARPPSTIGGDAETTAEEIAQARLETLERENAALWSRLSANNASSSAGPITTPLVTTRQTLSENSTAETHEPAATATVSTTNAATSGTSTSNANTKPLSESSLRDLILPSSLEANETARSFARRANTALRAARTEITRLKDQLARSSAISAATTSTTTAPIVITRNTSGSPRPSSVSPRQVSSTSASGNASGANNSSTVDLKAQNASLREELSRKSKLLTALKAAKTADSNALEQWRTDATAAEETIRRLQRAIASKDAVVKDLRTRIDALEEALTSAERDTSNESNAASAATLTPVQLRTRLRELELEKSRMKTRLEALKSRVADLDSQLAQAAVDAEAAKVVREKLESAQAALRRKDTLLAAQKNALDAAKAERDEAKSHLETVRIEGERRAVALSKQLEAALRSQHDSEREAELMRTRLVTATDTLTRHHAEREAQDLDEYINTTSNTQRNGNLRYPPARTTHHSRATPSQPAQVPSSPTAATRPPSMWNTATSGAARAARRSDVRDVIAALGSPAGDGLGVAHPPPSRRTSDDELIIQGEDGSASNGAGDLLSRLYSLHGVIPSSPSDLNSSSGADLSSAESVQSGDSGSNSAVSRVEQRLQALVSAALRSPPRR